MWGFLSRLAKILTVLSHSGCLGCRVVLLRDHPLDLRGPETLQTRLGLYSSASTAGRSTANHGAQTTDVCYPIVLELEVENQGVDRVGSFEGCMGGSRSRLLSLACSHGGGLPTCVSFFRFPFL